MASIRYLMPALLSACCGGVDAVDERPAGPAPATPSAATAADPLPLVSIHLVAVRCGQDFAPLPAGADAQQQMLRHLQDPWGLWQSGVAIKVGLIAPQGWELIDVDKPSQVAARLDSGEVLTLQSPGSFNRFGMFSQNGNTSLWDDPGAAATRGLERPLIMYLGAPLKSASHVVSLTGSCTVLLQEQRCLKHVVITPKAGAEQDIPEGALWVSMKPDGMLVVKYAGGGNGPRDLDRISYLGVDGKPLRRQTWNQRGNGHGLTFEMSFDRPVGTIGLDFYDKPRAATADFVLSDLPLVGQGDAAVLAPRAATAMHELPPPDLSVPPADAAMPARRLAPAPAKQKDDGNF